jgi:hypothetical protein
VGGIKYPTQIFQGPPNSVSFVSNVITVVFVDMRPRLTGVQTEYLAQVER